MKKNSKKKFKQAPADKKPSDSSWLYTDIVKDHFFNPRNVQVKDPNPGEFDGRGTVGSPVCGDIMTVWIKVDPKTERIVKCHWKTFGCASAIASTSIMSEMVTANGGMTIDQALELKPEHILKQLGGLPPKKIHCSVLGDQALRAAIEDYKHGSL